MSINLEKWQAPATKGDVARLALVVKGALIYTSINARDYLRQPSVEKLQELIAQLDKYSAAADKLFEEMSGWVNDG